MNRNFKDILSQKGSMMVEALAMLGLISMVTPVLYKKAAERTTELQDINSATYMRTLSQSLDDYIQDNYSILSQVESMVIPVAPEDIASYLPYGFNINGSKLFDEYHINVIRNNRGEVEGRSVVNLTGVITAPISLKEEDTTREIRKAKIASMIGANGGVRKGNNFTGVLGGWEIPVNALGLPDEDQLAVTSVHAITSGGSADSEHVLYRDDSRGDIAYNTMQTTLYMDTNNIEGISNLVAATNASGGSNTITIKGVAEDPGNLIVSGAAEIQQALTAGLNDENTAKLNVADTFYAMSADKTSNLILRNGRARLVGNDSKLDFNETETSLVGKTSELKFDNAGAIMTSGGNKGAKLALSSQDAQLTFGEGANGYSVGESSASVTFNSSKVNLNAGAVAIQSGDSPSFASIEVADSGITGVADKGVRLDSGSEMLLRGSEYFELSTGGAGISGADGSMHIGAERMNLTGNNEINLNSNEINLIGDNYVKLTSGRNSIELNREKDYIQFASSDAKLKLDSSKNNAALFSGDLPSKVPDNSVVLSAKSSFNGNNTVSVTPEGTLIRTQGDFYDGSYLYVKEAGGITMSGGEGITASAEIINLSSVTDVNIRAGGLNVTSYDNALKSNKTSFCDGNDCPNDDNSTFAKGVLVRHKGIVALPTAQSSGIASTAGVQDVSGYVKADRFLANQAYTSPYSSSRAGSKPYDAYQVNPAYTSVMHDIKLTTRGGARLSDILPDFINKGIYVVDNTYKEDQSNLNWENFTKDHDQTSCGTNLDCITTPWLGFIPAPQCPPGYAKVITINPIRWKMAEAYTVVTENIPSYAVAYQDFRDYFKANTDPLKSWFELQKAGEGGVEHTHGVETGRPLTFQTNTWLNTTIYGVRATPNDASSAFYGWHAIMGFLYHGSFYSDYIQGVGNTSEDFKGKVVWNIFPVYNQELTAISNVYCYFERSSSGNNGQYGSGNTGVSWDSNLVDTKYDQLNNFRSPTDDKDSDYTNRLNDPTLGYTDPW